MIHHHRSHWTSRLTFELHPPPPTHIGKPMVRNRAQVNQAVLLGAHEQGCPPCLAISRHLTGHLEGQTHTEGRKEFTQEGASSKRNENLFECEVLIEDMRAVLGVLKFDGRDLCFPVMPRFCILEKQYCLKDRQPFCWKLGYKNSSCTTRAQDSESFQAGEHTYREGGHWIRHGVSVQPSPPHTWPHADFPFGCS